MFAVIVFAAFGMLAVLPLMGAPKGVLLGAVALLPGLKAARMLMRQPEWTSAIIPAQSRTLVAFLLYALGVGLGFLLS